ncbi:MAG: agmatine deiminase family protein [Syntrophomonadaceae bacterium]
MKRSINSLILLFLMLVIYLPANPVISTRKYAEPDQENTVFPGEFDPQQAIWLMWPSDIYTYSSQPVEKTMAVIIETLARHIRVNLMVNSDLEIRWVKNRFQIDGFSGENVYFYKVLHQTIWARDVGPTFINSEGQLQVVNFAFNNFGRQADPDYIRSESLVDVRSADLLELPVLNTGLVSEGGGIESNGRGTIITTEAVALKRNPGLTKEQIEQQYQRVLGIKKVIWLSEGLAEEDGITGGHVDEMVRFADPHTILLAQVLPEDRNSNNISRASYEHLEENYRTLCKASDQDGQPFRIIRLPMPPTLYRELDHLNDIPVRSYLNFAISNGIILMPVYWKQGRSTALQDSDQQVRVVLQGIFPGREVVGIDVESINHWGGGIHCVTQHMPLIP